jgi:hypothetical protein
MRKIAKIAVIAKIAKIKRQNRQPQRLRRDAEKIGKLKPRAKGQEPKAVFP